MSNEQVIFPPLELAHQSTEGCLNFLMFSDLPKFPLKKDLGYDPDVLTCRISINFLTTAENCRLFKSSMRQTLTPDT